MEIKKVLTPTGISILKHFMDKSGYHFASISDLAHNLKRAHKSVSHSANILAEAGILNRCNTGKMILYMRNPKSNFLATWRALTEMIEKE